MSNNIIIILIFIIISIFLYFNYYYNNEIEGYDDRHLNSEMGKCAEFCKTTADCYSFAFDHQNKICYPSRKPLSGNPALHTVSGVSTIATLPGQSAKSRISGFPKGSIYEDDYEPDHTFCNKMFTVNNPSKTISFVQRRSNAIFSCTDKERLQPQYYYHNSDRFIEIDEGQNFDFLPQVDEYDVNPHRWPRGKLDMEQVDLLRNRPKRRLGRKYDKEYKTIKLFDKADVNLDINSPKYDEDKYIKLNLKNIGNIVKGIVDTGLSNVLQSDISKESNIELPDRPVNMYKAFKIHSDFNEGEYLRVGEDEDKYGYTVVNNKIVREKGRRCTSNIPLKKCMKTCADVNQCIGFEWNPSVFNDEQVCCLYKTQGKFIPRGEQHRLGKFYLKEMDDELDKNKFYTYY